MKAFYASIVILISSIDKAGINVWVKSNKSQKIVLNSVVQFATSSSHVKTRYLSTREDNVKVWLQFMWNMR